MSRKGNPDPGLLIAGVRSGGTFLCTALSNHPQIFCTRGEPAHPRSVWRSAAPDWHARLELLWTQQWYEAAMFKLTEQQAFWPPGWEFIQQQRPFVKIIHLRRENILHQALSNMISILNSEGSAPGHEFHTFKSLELSNIEIPPDRLVDLYRASVTRTENALAILNKCNLPILYLTYEQITGGVDASYLQADVSNTICDFFQVNRMKMYSHMKKVHTKPYSETVSNWDEVLYTLKSRGYDVSRYK